jgi:hypothetical protein
MAEPEPSPERAALTRLQSDVSALPVRSTEPLEELLYDEHGLPG